MGLAGIETCLSEESKERKGGSIAGDGMVLEGSGPRGERGALRPAWRFLELAELIHVFLSLHGQEKE